MSYFRVGDVVIVAASITYMFDGIATVTHTPGSSVYYRVADNNGIGYMRRESELKLNSYKTFIRKYIDNE